MHRLGDSVKNRTNCSIVVVRHLSLGRSTLEHRLGEPKTAVELRRQVLDLCQKVVLSRPIQLGNTLGSISVCDTVRTILQLLLNVVASLLSEFSASIALDHIWKLNDQV